MREFWAQETCGEVLYLDTPTTAGFAQQAKRRYELEPFIAGFAAFADYSGKRVLEVGVGLGADHQCFAASGAEAWGIDLTERAVALVQRRFRLSNLRPRLAVADAEVLPFPSDYFDLVYSWGVLHHVAEPAKMAAEVLRVLRPGGEFKIMIYHKHSLVGYMLWVRYALLRLRPFRSLDSIYSSHLESPGTRAFSVSEAVELFAHAARIEARTVLTHGDLLASPVGQRHRGPLLSVARRVWPRWAVRRLFKGSGLFMLIKGVK